MAQWLDDLHASQDVLRSVEMQLRSLASAFSTTGNDRAAKDLWRMADKVRDVDQTVSHATGVVVGQMVTASQEATANMMNTALAVIVSQRPDLDTSGAKNAFKQLTGGGKDQQ